MDTHAIQTAIRQNETKLARQLDSVKTTEAMLGLLRSQLAASKTSTK